MDFASTEAQAPTGAPDEIVARAGRYYRWTRYLISVGLLIGYGSFFIKDGFFTWPRELEQARYLESIGRHAEVKPESETAIQVNRALGVTMPPLGVALLCWTLYNSRGQYRLSGHILYVPGHPPVPLESILKMDMMLWEKKGIAYIEYMPPDSPAGSSRTLKLDDFVYDQTPTDAIVERIEQIIAPAEDEHGSPASSNDSEHPAGDEAAV